ncbi:uncharacterized protein LOC120339425 [Styela clava]
MLSLPLRSLLAQKIFHRTALRCVHVTSKHASEDEPKKKFDTFPISRYPLPKIETLPQSIQDRISEADEKTGFVPNVMTSYAHRPKEFEAFFNYYDVLMQKETGNLSKADREMIVVATSSYNSCLYCVVSHSALYRIFSKNPIVADQVATCWEAAAITDRERAILELAMAVCKSEEISQHYFDNLAKHGLDAEDAWDIAAISAFFSMSNRMAHFMNMRPNEEFHLMGRVPKTKSKPAK